MDNNGSAKLRSVICGLLALLLVGFSMPFASATLLSVDHVPGSGDGLITVDTETRLGWLDLTATVGLSHDDVRAGAGGWVAAGFRHASYLELRAFLRHAGVTLSDSIFDNRPRSENAAPLRALMELIGVTLYFRDDSPWALGVTGTCLYHALEVFSAPSLCATSPTSLVPGKLRVLGPSTLTFPEAGSVEFVGGIPDSDDRNPIFGHYLVRTVPEPSVLALLLLPLCVLLRQRAR